MHIVEDLLPYWQRLEERASSAIELIVIHSTELPDIRIAREYGERIVYEKDGFGVSGHYYVDRDGEIYRYVPDNRIAHHTIGFNEGSIGIELVNLGRYPNWFSSKSQTPSELYPSQQLRSLEELIQDLRTRYPSLKQIARHSDLDTSMVQASDDPDVMIRRKIDPGPMFPWDDLVSFWSKL